MEDLRIEVYFIYLLVASFSNIWILDGRIHSSLSTETWDSVYSVILSLENREKSTISFHISSFTNVGKTCPVSLLSIMVGPPLLSGWLEDKGGNTQDDPGEAGRSLQMRMWDRLGGTRRYCRQYVDMSVTELTCHFKMWGNFPPCGLETWPAAVTSQGWSSARQLEIFSIQMRDQLSPITGPAHPPLLSSVTYQDETLFNLMKKNKQK